MRRIGIGSVLAALLAFGVPPAATAAAAAPTVCTYRWEVTVSPGLTVTPGSGTVSTGGATGTITCNGTVDGQTPTGSGSVTIDAVYEESTCLGGKGTGTYSFTLPTSSGSVTVTDNFTWTYGLVPADLNLAGPFAWTGQRSSGTGLFVPTQGTCLLDPMTAAHGEGQGQFPS
jgi:hypothetical protein